MKKIIYFVFICILFVACQGGANSQHPTVEYEDKKSSLSDMEKNSPLKFLKVNGSNRNNLVNQTVVEGEITNKATLTSYKNIQLQFIFKDDAGSEIEKQKHVLDEVVKPNSTTDYKVKVKHVKGANTVVVDIINASAL